LASNHVGSFEKATIQGYAGYSQNRIEWQYNRVSSIIKKTQE